ncbi:MAG: putative phage tail protein [Tistlia sp.]|uniref:YmfQ family protein n=1 Tax=Tistlia sp. TaxID=3057121 RepID=UPI0034A31532
MRVFPASVGDYAAQLAQLLPRGAAWPTDPDSRFRRLLSGLAASLAAVHSRALALLNEADPRTTLELLPEWEEMVGEPDLCAGPAEGLQLRRQRVVAKLLARGGQSRAFMIQLAASFGYGIEITEYRPFIAGLSHCGDELLGGHAVRHVWSVSVPDARLTYFRTGVSSPGERLLAIGRAEDLECVLRRAQPAHTNLLFSYEGV